MRLGILALAMLTAAPAHSLTIVLPSCQEKDGKTFAEISRVGERQIHAELLEDRSHFIFVVCTEPAQAIRVTNADRPNSRRSPMVIVRRAAESDARIPLGGLRRRLDNAGYSAFLSGYRSDGCLCDQKTIDEAFVPLSLEDKVNKEDPN